MDDLAMPAVDAPAVGGPPAADRARAVGLDVGSADQLIDPHLRRWLTAAAVGDFAVALVAGTIARLLRFGFDDTAVAGEGITVSYLVIGLVVAFAWPVLNALSGAYDYRASLFGIEEIRRIIRSGLALLSLLALVYFALQLQLSRGFVAFLVPAVISGTAVWRLALRNRIKARQLKGRWRHRAVIVGPLEEVYRVCVDLQTRPDAPIEIIAFVADDLEPDAAVPLPMRRLQRLATRDEIGHTAPNGMSLDLLLRAGQPHRNELWWLATRAHEKGLAVAIAPSRTDAANVGFSYLPLGGTPLLMVESPSFRPATRVAKAAVDRFAAVVLLVVLSPLFLACAVAVLVGDGRPVIFRQERVGRNGKPFTILKFRTMAPDAESLVLDLDSDRVEGPLFKMKNDPRVTRVGAVLRHRSLDELPQLLNVLRGEMSVVGPRPPLPAEVASYDERTARRLLVRPGITGLWQVSGRSELGWDEAVYLDLMYVDHWSPLLDVAIIARTALAVIRPRGAY